MSEIEDIEAARAAYARVQPLYERLAAEIQHMLETRLAEAGPTPVSITHRSKTIESFAAKIARKNYNDPLSQMTDLAGVRVVCAFEAELARPTVVAANSGPTGHFRQSDGTGGTRRCSKARRRPVELLVGSPLRCHSAR
jgi:ppGpp synthetase/RelA/SpoT-type nucleotidyltranferase